MLAHPAPCVYLHASLQTDTQLDRNNEISLGFDWGRTVLLRANILDRLQYNAIQQTSVIRDHPHAASKALKPVYIDFDAEMDFLRLTIR